MSGETKIATFSGEGFTKGDVEDQLVNGVNNALAARNRSERISAKDVQLKMSSPEGASLTVVALLGAGAMGFAGGVGSEFARTLIREAVDYAKKKLGARAELAQDTPDTSDKGGVGAPGGAEPSADGQA